MVSEPDTKQCANEDTGTKRGGLRDPTSVGEENETFFIRMWKSLACIKPKRESPKRIISTHGGVGLSRFWLRLCFYS